MRDHELKLQVQKRFLVFHGRTLYSPPAHSLPEDQVLEESCFVGADKCNVSPPPLGVPRARSLRWKSLYQYPAGKNIKTGLYMYSTGRNKEAQEAYCMYVCGNEQCSINTILACMIQAKQSVSKNGRQQTTLLSLASKPNDPREKS